VPIKSNHYFGFVLEIEKEIPANLELDLIDAIGLWLVKRYKYTEFELWFDCRNYSPPATAARGPLLEVSSLSSLVASSDGVSGAA